MISTTRVKIGMIQLTIRNKNKERAIGVGLIQNNMKLGEHMTTPTKAHRKKEATKLKIFLHLSLITNPQTTHP